MATPRIEYAVLPAGDGPGQDRCFTADGLVVVLDGASAYDPTASPDAGKFVDTLGPALIQHIVSQPGIDLRGALAKAILGTADELGLVAGSGPSSTVSIVRWHDNDVDVLVLGDSPVIVQFNDGSQQTLVQHPQAHIAPELRRQYRRRLAAGHGYDETHRELLAGIQRSEVAARNKPTGYYIAEAEPAAAAHSLIRSFVATTVDYIIVVTDGVSYQREVVKQAEAMARTGSSPDRLARLLHALESWERERDPDGRLHPRSKAHDDKTLVTLSASPSE